MTEIRTLIDEIKSNRMRLPEMQRAYVWKSTQVRDLLDSLYRKYPTGTILRWETTQKVPTRDFAVSQDDTKYESYYFVNILVKIVSLVMFDKSVFTFVEVACSARFA